ncbi:hypothetical protein FISHEDRAFT_56982 [Fistulina hepatica ATCC 64428]|nr:hypothetical protein FISHEDRAFT_56982 [Fistulina hepatica ATCC 64428]
MTPGREISNSIHTIVNTARRELYAARCSAVTDQCIQSTVTIPVSYGVRQAATSEKICVRYKNHNDKRQWSMALDGVVPRHKCYNYWKRKIWQKLITNNVWSGTKIKYNMAGVEPRPSSKEEEKKRNMITVTTNGDDDEQKHGGGHRTMTEQGS